MIKQYLIKLLIIITFITSCCKPSKHSTKVHYIYVAFENGEDAALKIESESDKFKIIDKNLMIIEGCTSTTIARNIQYFSKITEQEYSEHNNQYKNE